MVIVTPSYTHLHREAGRDDHEANPFLLAKWRSVMMVTHTLTARGQKGRGGHGLYHLLLWKWMSLSLPEVSREGVSMT